MNSIIDTDKYEGHTEGPWAWERGALNVLHVKDSEPMHTLLHDEKKDVDAQLIADAPLLLAEVKRLNMVVNMLRKNDLWVSTEGWEESDKDDELIVSMNYLIQASLELRGDLK